MPDFTSRGEDFHLTDDDYDKGPPEVDVEGRVAFEQRSPADQDRAWQAWFDAGHGDTLLDQARQLARQALELAPQQLQLDPEARYLPARDGFPLEVAVGTGTKSVWFDPDMFDAGPPDLPGGAFDPTFRFLTDPIAKQDRWDAYLKTHEKPPDQCLYAQAYFLAVVDVLERQNDVRTQTRCLACLGIDFTKNPKRSWAFVVGGLLGVVGVVGGAIFGGLRHQTDYGAPSGLTAVATGDGKGGYVVTVTWSAPVLDPAAAVYEVTLSPRGSGATTARTVRVDGGATSTTLVAAVGDFDVSVTGIWELGTGRSATVTVTVPGPAAPPPSGRPDPPTAVALTAGSSGTTGRRGFTVTWTAPAAGPAVGHYTVTLTPALPKTPAGVGLMTSYRADEPPAGTYQAGVTASNATGTSDAATSAPLAYTTAPATAPGPPGSPQARLFLAPSGKPALTVFWNPPTGGAEVTDYAVTLSGTIPLHTGLMRAITYPDVADGPYTVTVVAANGAGAGAAASATVTVDRSTLTPGGLDWSTTFGADQIKTWQAMRDDVSAMDEDAFWGNILDVLTDKAGVHGGVASYADQLVVATLLTIWVARPKENPPDRATDARATRLAAACDPDFPPAPSTTEYGGDPLALWRAAQDFTATGTPTQIVLRYKLFAIARALQRYLGVG